MGATNKCKRSAIKMHFELNNKIIIKYLPMNEQQAMKEYQDLMIQENEQRQSQIKETLDLVKPLVSDKHYAAITDWIKDEENGIWGKLEIVSKPKGEWQDEGNYDYWAELKGMYVDQYVGCCGDDYSGYLAIKLPNKQYLQACFEL